MALSSWLLAQTALVVRLVATREKEMAKGA